MVFPQHLQHKWNLLLLFRTRHYGLFPHPNLQFWHKKDTQELLASGKYTELYTVRKCLCLAHFIFSIEHNSRNEYFCVNKYIFSMVSESHPPSFSFRVGTTIISDNLNSHLYLWHLYIHNRSIKFFS